MPTDPFTDRVHREIRTAIMTLIRHRGPASRSELATALGLGRTQVEGAVDALIKARLLTEDQGPVGPGRGRPGRRLRRSHPSGGIVGVDLGHHHVLVAVASLDLQVRAKRTVLLDVDADPDRVLDTVASLIPELLAEAGPDLGPVEVCVAGVPGPLDGERRAVASPTILANWSGLDVAGELAGRTGLRVALENDANLGALAEHRAGPVGERDDMIYVKAADGVGAGLYIGGALVRGNTGAAGEIGHTQVSQDGDWCRCGNRGCLETIISVRQVLAQISHLHAAGGDSLRGRLAEVAGHPVARKILAESGRTLGRVLANLCALLDPKVVIIGGELSQAGEPFLDGVRESIDRLAQPGYAGRVAVLPAILGLDAEITGSLSLARELALREIRL